MKKEVKVITKEDSIEESSKKLQRKFKSLKGWANLISIVFWILLMIVVVAGIYDIANIKNQKFEDTVLNSVILDSLDIEVGIDEENESYIIKNDGAIISRELSVKSDKYMYPLVLDYLTLILLVITQILIVEGLAKIFENTAEKGTPFTDENADRFNKISIRCFVLFLIGFGPFSIGLTSLILIEAVLTILRYGCKLQEQVDETL